MAEYCRMFPAQITAWRVACEQANDWDRWRLGKATKEEKRRVKDLERELAQRLGGNCSALVLRAIWGDGVANSLINEAITERPAPRWKSVTAPCGAGRKARFGLISVLVPSNKLSEAERAAVLEACNSKEFSSLPPSQIVPNLADQGLYLASESSFYRILRADGQQHHRGRAKPAVRRKPPTSYQAALPVRS